MKVHSTNLDPTVLPHPFTIATMQRRLQTSPPSTHIWALLSDGQARTLSLTRTLCTAFRIYSQGILRMKRIGSQAVRCSCHSVTSPFACPTASMVPCHCHVSGPSNIGFRSLRMQHCDLGNQMLGGSEIRLWQGRMLAVEHVASQGDQRRMASCNAFRRQAIRSRFSE